MVAHIGSVTAKVVRHATVPVLTLRVPIRKRAAKRRPWLGRLVRRRLDQLETGAMVEAILVAADEVGVREDLAAQGHQAAAERAGILPAHDCAAS